MNTSSARISSSVLWTVCGGETICQSNIQPIPLHIPCVVTFLPICFHSCTFNGLFHLLMPYGSQVNHKARQFITCISLIHQCSLTWWRYGMLHFRLILSSPSVSLNIYGSNKKKITSSQMCQSNVVLPLFFCQGKQTHIWETKFHIWKWISMQNTLNSQMLHPSLTLKQWKYKWLVLLRRVKQRGETNKLGGENVVTDYDGIFCKLQTILHLLKKKWQQTLVSELSSSQPLSSLL